MTRPYTPDELADRWQCSAETIRAMYRSGRLPHFYTGRMIRIAAHTVEGWECGNIGSDDSRGDSLPAGERPAAESAIVLMPTASAMRSERRGT